MIRIREAIIVEGRYDKNTLAQVVDAPILETSGFGIFHDSQPQQRRVPGQAEHLVPHSGTGHAPTRAAWHSSMQNPGQISASPETVLPQHRRITDYTTAQ